MGIKIILNQNATADNPGITGQPRVPVKIYTDDIDQGAIEQLQHVAALPFIHSHIAVMPDVHVGIGATVGSVIPTRQAIIPAAVGVDIGCGMNAVRLSLKATQLPDNLYSLRSAIERDVPAGFAQHRTATAQASTFAPLAKRLEAITTKHPGLLKMLRKFDTTWRCQLGTLGGGNHFIELCIDENQDVWVMLHSGSRGLGNCIGTYFITLAKKTAEQQFGAVTDPNLSYFCEGSAQFEDYMEAVHWAQDYAMENRREMMRLVIGVLERKLPAFTLTREAINCHHNYVAEETHFGQNVYITRKGAISARQDQLGIIPGSMGARSFIVRGKGNSESFCSCSHGAGRRLSRNRAKELFTGADLVAQTAGVECRKDTGVLDEIPGAYKPIDEVMANQSDLVDVVHTLKQVLCIKG